MSVVTEPGERKTREIVWSTGKGRAHVEGTRLCELAHDPDGRCLLSIFWQSFHETPSISIQCPVLWGGHGVSNAAETHGGREAPVARAYHLEPLALRCGRAGQRF